MYQSFEPAVGKNGNLHISLNVDLSSLSLLFMFWRSADTLNIIKVRETFGLEHWCQYQKEGARLVDVFQHNYSLCLFFSPPVFVWMSVAVCVCPGGCLGVVRGDSLLITDR